MFQEYSLSGKIHVSKSFSLKYMAIYYDMLCILQLHKHEEGWSTPPSAIPCSPRKRTIEKLCFLLQLLQTLNQCLHFDYWKIVKNILRLESWELVLQLYTLNQNLTLIYYPIKFLVKIIKISCEQRRLAALYIIIPPPQAEDNTRLSRRLSIQSSSHRHLF